MDWISKISSSYDSSIDLEEKLGDSDAFEAMSDNENSNDNSKTNMNEIVDALNS